MVWVPDDLAAPAAIRLGVEGRRVVGIAVVHYMDAFSTFLLSRSDLMVLA